MKLSYGSIQDAENYANALNSNTHKDKTWSRRGFRIVAVVVFVAVIAAVGFTIKLVPERSGVVLLMNQKILNLQNSNTIFKDEDYVKQLFDDFVVEYNKQYENENEYLRRYAIFKKNLAAIDVRNAEESASDGHAVHGVTKFTDQTEEEFYDILNLIVPSRSEFENDGEPEFKITLKSFSDWRSTYVTAVKDQGSCGSC